MAMLVGTDTLEACVERQDAELAAQALGQQLIIAPVSSEGEFDGVTSIVGRRKTCDTPMNVRSWG